MSVRVVARCCALASLSWKEPPSGIDPAVGDEGGKARPCGVLRRCRSPRVQMTWLLKKVDALTR